MNFKDWMKIDEDDKSCTLRHPKGHVMKIAVKSLPKIQQEQLRRLEFAKGGKVEGMSQQGRDVRHAKKMKEVDSEESKQDMRFAKDEAKGRAEFERHIKPKMKGLSHGGKVDKKDEPKGDDIGAHNRKESGFWDSEHGKQALAEQNKEVENIRHPEKRESQKPFHGLKKKVKHYAEGTPDEPVHEDSPSQSPAMQMDPQSAGHTPITINVGAPSAPSAAAPAPMPAPPAPPIQSVPSPEQKMVQPPNDNPNMMLPDQTINAPAAVQLQQKAIQQQSQIQSEAAKGQAQYENEYLKERQRINQMDQEHYNELKQHTDEFKDYLNKNPINPNHYMENRGGGTKVMNAIGLFLGGMGVPFGGHNYAMDFLNKQIDRDIEGQKARADQQKTVWGAYRDLYGDSTVATALSKVSANDILVHQANITAAQLGTAQAQQKANELASAKALENNQLLIDSAGRLGSLRTGGGYPGLTQSAPQGPSGASFSPNKAPPAKEAEHKALEETILHPGAEKMFQGLQYTPKAKDQIPEITRQFTQAQQADKALKDINGVYMNMWKNANDSGVSGRVHRSINPHALAAGAGGLGALAGATLGFGVGAMPAAAAAASVGEGVGHGIKAMTNTDQNRQYDSDKTALLGYVSAALKGTNIGSQQIQEIVDANSPEYGDSDKSVAKKLKNIRDFIKNHTETSLLKTWHLSHD